MKKHRLAIKISVPVLVFLAVVLLLPIYLRWSPTVAAAGTSDQRAPIVHHVHRDTPHMHVKNWML